jgi:hypothetical protein
MPIEQVFSSILMACHVATAHAHDGSTSGRPAAIPIKGAGLVI